MIYRTLGRTGLRISEIGFGCGSVGGLMVRGSLEEQLAAVRYAISLRCGFCQRIPGGRTETELQSMSLAIRPKSGGENIRRPPISATSGP